MKCGSCECHLIDAKDLFFFIKGPKDIHLALKPEKRANVEERVLVKVRETERKVRIKCKKCLENTGVEVPFGPGGTSFIGFGTEKIIFLGSRFSNKRKWSQILSQFPQIDNRNEDTFFGPRYRDSCSSQQARSQERPAKPTMRFPSPDSLQDFEWYPLTPRKTARDYQVEAYIEALQRNLVVVIDTGLGKTLIASMVIAKMKSLNPHRMGLMLVDRIPLVFQQGQAIMADTGLRVCCICGENRTQRKIKQLHDGSYDVLVITAGSFNELLSRDKVGIDDFSVIVFDECHHATGGHVYTTILGFIERLPRSRWPRILGLTASPFKVDNLEKGRNQLLKFQQRFLNSSFFYPETHNEKTTPEQISFTRDTIQISFIRDAMNLVREKGKLINRIVAGYDISSTLNESQLHKLKGEIKSLQQEFINRKELQDLAKAIILLIDAIDICDLVGVKCAVEVLANTLQLPKDIAEFKDAYADFCHTPPRLTLLEDILHNCTSETRTIIFVKTQIAVSKLYCHLEKRFPNLHPRKMFGHGGFYGMRWDEEQKEVLKEFREGKSNLLISTSVLEEGLDVAQCNMVIRYAGPMNLISFIQSRGRARSHKSRYLIFVEESQKRSVSDLENQENVLKFIINNEGTSGHLPTALSRELKVSLESELPECVVQPSRQPVAEGEKITATFQIFVRASEEQELVLNEALVQELEDLDQIKVQRIFAEERSASQVSGTHGIFASQDRALFVSLQSDFIDIWSAYENLCKVWGFKISGSRNQDQIWCQLTNLKFPGEVVNQWEPVRVEFGKFNSRQIFEVSKIVGSMNDSENRDCIVTSLTFNSLTSVVIEFRFRAHDGIQMVDMEIPLTEINNFALVSFIDNKPCLYLPLKSSPYLFIHVSEKRLRYVGSEYLLDVVAENPIVALTLNEGTWQALHCTLSSPEILPVPVFDTRVTHQYALERENDLRDTKRDLLENSSEQLSSILWKLGILDSKRDICLPLEDMIYLYEKLKKVNEDPDKLDLFEHSVDQVLALCRESFWFDVKESFIRTYANMERLPRNSLALIRTPVPTNHVLVKRLVVTPSRIICRHALPTASNRLLRYFGADHEFIVVSFREEQFQKLHDTGALRRVTRILENGITIVKQYWFFCASGSQFRDHKAYFVAAHSYDEVQALRSKIIENEHCFKSTAKYLSRLGLFCTADKPAYQIPRRRMVLKDDITSGNGDIVTDGCGKIAKSLAKTVIKILGLTEQQPSALQIRVAGIKGVLLVVDDDDQDVTGYDIMYRKSMLKFESSDEMLCVVSTAKYNNLFLNREVITLLTSINNSFTSEALWQIEHTITELHESAICNAASIFDDTKSACIALMEHMPKSILDRTVSGGYDILSEPYWFSLLQTVYRLAVADIRFKTRIPIEQACLLMGVADPSGNLKDDEIFVQVQVDDNSPSKVITGKVLLYRNPCLYPGDLRWVTAVGHCGLAHLKNVVVMPTNNCSSSLAAKCSGGDLDGDEFAVIWDPRFIPPTLAALQPLNYAELAKGSPEDFDQNNQKELFAQFYTRIIANDTLGRVAHIHLALCDQLQMGACDDLAMALAKSQSQAVDFPKTGIIPEVPKEAVVMVTKKGYPDFMEKTKNESYVSQKLLGKLFRRCRSLMFDFELSSEKKRLSCDLDLVIEGNEIYLNEAKVAYIAYSLAFKALMVRFGLKREAEVILGKAIKWSTLLSADKGSVSKSIALCYSALEKKYRDEFFSDVYTDYEIWRKASAWYRVVYDESLKGWMPRKSPLRSFAWIVGDILCSIKKEKQLNIIEKPNLVSLSIGESAYQEFLKSRVRIESVISVKENARRCIESEINRDTGKSAFSIRSYGSVSMYLCEHESDLDISIQPKQQAWKKWGPQGNLTEQALSRHFLESVISRALDGIANTKTHKLDASVPLISITVGDSENTTSVDISMNRVGELKTDFMLMLYKSNPITYPFMWILVRWARCVGMVKSGQDTGSLIATAEFYILVIYLMQLNETGHDQVSQLKRPFNGSVHDKENCSDCSGQGETMSHMAVWLNGQRHLYMTAQVHEQWDINPLIDLTQSTNSEPVTKSISMHPTVRRLIDSATNSLPQHKAEVGDMLVTFFRRGAALDGDIELIWPNEEILNVFLPAQTTKLIRTHCMNGLHIILATRNVSTMLSYVQDSTKQQTEFAKKLPYTLSSAIGKAVSFHSAILSSISGAQVEIKEQPGMGYLLLTASGTRSAVMKLKEELHDLSVTNRALKLGRLPKKTSRYFMEGSTMLMTQESASPDTMVIFEKSEGPYNVLHHLRERHYLKLNSEPEDQWLEKAVDGLSKRMANQMHKFPVKSKDMLDSLRVTITYGCFYTVEISSSLPPTQPTESIGNLEFKVEKNGSTRKNWQRGEYTGQKTYSGDMIKLPPAAGNPDGLGKKKANCKEKNCKKRSTVTSAFCPGILEMNCSSLASIETCEQLFRDALIECDFEDGSNGFCRNKSPWKLTAVPSTSYEVLARLDKDFRVTEANERALKWVCANIVHGKDQRSNNKLMVNNDIRVTVDTRASVSPGSELYQTIVPKKDDAVLRIKAGKPDVVADYPEKNKSFLAMVSERKKIQTFKKEYFDATIATGVEYRGKDFAIGRKYCDVSLEFSPTRFKQALTENIYSDTFSGIAREILETAVPLSETIRRKVQEL